ncbi:LSm family protein [Paenibacillus pini]|uniref:DUF2642 domain-containing protein n=1 Tax=Paenibacillus pini JCM 16418 TaxID=1236976 RepID=W7YQ71_9BACL|nr:hypothetical protein [Paenibacillus pini]GAF06716.1 hypothetical protein JCM16418_690 [Paenibacillus pini JCM 16418]
MCFHWIRKHINAEIRHLVHEIQRLDLEIHQIEGQIVTLQAQVQHQQEQIDQLQEQVSTGLTTNPELYDYFVHKIGQEVRVDTTSVILTGIVLTVAVDAVELRESGGDIVIIPFAKISSAQ